MMLISTHNFVFLKIDVNELNLFIIMQSCYFEHRFLEHRFLENRCENDNVENLFSSSDLFTICGGLKMPQTIQYFFSFYTICDDF